MKLRFTRKRIFEIGAFIALALAVIVLAAVIASWIFLPWERIRNAIARELSERFNQDVAIGEVSLGFYPDLGLVAKRVTVVDRETSQTVISAQKIRIDTNFIKIIKGEFSLEEIIISSPVVHLVRETDGQWNIKRLADGMRSETASVPKKPDTDKRAGRSNVDRVVIQDGKVEYRDKARGLNLTIDKMRSMVDIEKDTLTLASATITSPPLEARITGKALNFSRPERTFDVGVTMLLKKEGRLANIGPPDVPIGEKLADALLNASGQGKKISLKSTFETNPSLTADVAANGNLAATLFTEENRLELASLDVAFGQSVLSLKGSCADVWSRERNASLKGNATVMLEEALSPLRKELVEKLEPEGTMNVEFEFMGSREQTDVKADFDLDDAGLAMPRVMHKHPGIPGSLKIGAQYTAPRKLVADTIELKIADNTILGSAALQPGAEPWMRASVKTAEFPLEKLDRLPSVCFEEGILTLDAEMWQASPAKKAMNYGGGAEIDHALFTAGILKRPTEVSHAKITFAEQGASIVTTGVFARSLCRAEGKITNFRKPGILGTIKADAISVDGLRETFGGKKDDDEDEQPEDRKSKRRPGYHLQLVIEADSLYWGKIKTGPVSATWQAGADGHVFEPIIIETYGGELRGKLEMGRKEGRFGWTSDFSGHNIELAGLSAQLKDDGEANIKGPMSVKGNLRGYGSSEAVSAARSLEGNVRLTSDGGEITQYSWIKNIFLMIQVNPGTMLTPGLRELTILNTVIDAAKTRGRSLNPTYTVFNSLGGNFHITGAVAHTEDLRLESGIADLIFKGEIDLVDRQMDMIVTATPLGSVGSLMEKVPLAGEALKKAKEATIATDFIVRGSLTEPEVKLAAVEKLIPKTDEQ
jgi:hypothetical protein